MPLGSLSDLYIVGMFQHVELGVQAGVPSPVEKGLVGQRLDQPGSR
jgi:hypothetical protein